MKSLEASIRPKENFEGFQGVQECSESPFEVSKCPDNSNVMCAW